MIAAGVGRGVYEQPHTDAAGTRTLVAVDSRGRLVATIAVPAECSDPWKATVRLRHWLDEVDPVGTGAPQLALV